MSVIRFKVWLRPEGDYCQVRVEGARNGRWLRKHLLRHGIASSSPVELVGTDACLFRVSLGRSLKFDRFKELISAISEVQLMFSMSL